jgi:magnesium transporter
MLEIFYYKNGLKKGKIEDLDKLKDEKIWIDVTNLTREETQILAKTFDLHPTTQEDLFKANVRIKVEEFEKYLFCIFYGIKNTKGIELYELDFVLGKDFVISNHKKPCECFEELKKDKERLESVFKKGEDFLLHELIDREIDNYFPLLENVDDQITKLEEQVSKKPKPKVLSEVLKLKRNVILIKRKVFEQREKVSFLAKRDYKFISRSAIPYFRDVYDNTIRVSDSLDNSRELIANAYDVYMSTMSNNMNEVMKVLSIIATLFLPLTVISSIYGTNFYILPGAHNPFGFWFMIIGMFVFSGILLLIFRKRGWF